MYVASRIDVYARRSAGPASRAEPSRRRDARRRAARRRAGRITGTQQSLAGLRAGMRWSRDACRDTQRLRPLTRSLAIIRRDISFPRVPLPRIDARFPSEDAHRVHRRTIAHFRIVSIRSVIVIGFREGCDRAHTSRGCISDLERVGCTVQCRLPLHPTCYEAFAHVIALALSLKKKRKT